MAITWQAAWSHHMHQVFVQQGDMQGQVIQRDLDTTRGRPVDGIAHLANTTALQAPGIGGREHNDESWGG